MYCVLRTLYRVPRPALRPLPSPFSLPPSPIRPMDIAELRRYLDDADAAADWLRSLGLTDLRRGHANFVEIAT